jgi:hypothetical protein
MSPTTLWSFHKKLTDLLTFPDNHKEKPIQFFVIAPDEPNRIIKLEYAQTMVDETGTVIQLKVVEDGKS